jgi:peptidoglycan/xylan/chitin deacetylase (PgdA/CDA1 family)
MTVGRNLVKSTLACGFRYTGLGAALRGARRLAGGPRIHILGYHRVVPSVRERGPSNPALCISVDAFRRQMEQVRAAFTVLPLDLAVAAVRGELSVAGDACAITFDDGYRDVATYAHPVLAALGLPATVFVPTGYVGATRPLLHDRLYAALWSLLQRRAALDPAALGAQLAAPLGEALRLLRRAGAGPAVDLLMQRVDPDALEALERELVEASDGPVPLGDELRVLAPDELRALSDHGWEIGAHTVGHLVLRDQPSERVRYELRAPRRELERWTGRRCRFFAYCNGVVDDRLVGAVRAAGYVAAVTTRARPNRLGDDVFRLSRKVLWEGHTRGATGRWSAALSAAHLHDLFGSCGLTEGWAPAPRPTPSTNDREPPPARSRRPLCAPDGAAR